MFFSSKREQTTEVVIQTINIPTKDVTDKYDLLY